MSSIRLVTGNYLTQSLVAAHNVSLRHRHHHAVSEWERLRKKYASRARRGRNRGSTRHLGPFQAASVPDGSLTFYWPQGDTGKFTILYCPDPSCPTGIFTATDRGAKKVARHFEEHGLDVKTLQHVVSLFGLQGMCCCSNTLCSIHRSTCL